ncbi:MAG: DUF416 family protein [Gammaproteobacteria bacterium]|nr:MAG: DUF416 family protein [Gammaproteobacteria bacterium]
MDKRHFKRVAKIRGWRESAFLAALAERNQINLLFFAQLAEDAVDWPVQPVTHALELVWRRLTQDQSFRAIRQLLPVEEMIERLSGDDHFGALAAGTACELIREALLSMENDHVRRAERAARQSLDLVIRYEELRHDDVPEENWVGLLDASPLVQSELAFQDELARQLQALKGPDPEVLAGLRALAHQDGVSNLGISLSDEEA